MSCRGRKRIVDMIWQCRWHFPLVRKNLLRWTWKGLGRSSAGQSRKGSRRYLARLLARISSAGIIGWAKEWMSSIAGRDPMIFDWSLCQTVMWRLNAWTMWGFEAMRPLFDASKLLAFTLSQNARLLSNPSQIGVIWTLMAWTFDVVLPNGMNICRTLCDICRELLGYVMNYKMCD